MGYSPRDHKESGRIVRLTFHFHGLPGSSAGKDSVCSEGELSLIPGPGRSPREGNDNLLQYSCPENSVDREAWWATVYGVTRSQT